MAEDEKTSEIYNDGHCKFIANGVDREIVIQCVDGYRTVIPHQSLIMLKKFLD